MAVTGFNQQNTIGVDFRSNTGPADAAVAAADRITAATARLGASGSGAASAAAQVAAGVERIGAAGTVANLGLGEIDAKITRLTARQHTIAVNADIKGAEERIAALDGEIAALQSHVKRLAALELDTKPARDALQNLEGRLDVLQDRRMSLVVDTTQAQGMIARIQSRIEALRATRADIHIDEKPALSAIERIKAKIAELQGGGAPGGLGSTNLSGVAVQALQRFTGSSALAAGSGASGAIGSVTSGMIRLAAAAGPAGIAVAAVGAAFLLVGGQAIQAAAQMETFTVQFEVLLKGADNAARRIGELTQFAKLTPFSLPEVVQASRILEVFSGSVLSVGDGLRLVGDVAAGTGNSINEVADNFGRLYTALKSGSSVGEQLYGLQRIGALSGEGSRRIAQLADSVKSGALTIQQAWPAAAREFSRFTGLMERQSETFAGKMSNLGDAVNQALAGLGSSLLPFAKLFLDVTIQFVNGIGTLIGAAQKIAAPFAALLALPIGGFFKALGLALEAVGAAIEFVGNTVAGFYEFLGNVGARLGEFIGSLPVVGDALGALGEGIGAVGRFAGEVIDNLGKGAGRVGEFFDMIADSVKSAEQLAAEAASDQADAVAQAYKDKQEAIQAQVDRIAQALPEALRLMLGETQTQAYAQLEMLVKPFAENRQLVDSAWTSFLNDEKKYLDERVRVAELAGRLTSKALMDALNSDNVEFVKRAREQVLLARAELEKLTGKKIYLPGEVSITGFAFTTGTYADAIDKQVRDAYPDAIARNRAADILAAQVAGREQALAYMEAATEPLATLSSQVDDLIAAAFDQRGRAGAGAMEQIAERVGFLESPELTAGLNAIGERTRAAFKDAREGATTELEQLLREISPQFKVAQDLFRRLGPVGGAAKPDPLGWAERLFGDNIREAAKIAQEQARSAGAAATIAFSDGLRSRQDEISAAVKQLNEDYKTQMSKTAEIAALMATLASSKLAKALADSRPVVHGDAVKVTDLVVKQLELLGVDTSKLSGTAAANIAEAFKDPAILGDAADSSEALGDAILNGLNSIDWYSEGYGHADVYMRGQTDRISGAGPDISRAQELGIAPYIKGESPPPRGPLSQIDKWGENVGQAWIDGLNSAMRAPAISLDGVSSRLQSRLQNPGAIPMGIVPNMVGASPATVAAQGRGGDRLSLGRTETILERQLAQADLSNRLLGRLTAKGDIREDLIGQGVLAKLRQEVAGELVA